MYPAWVNIVQIHLQILERVIKKIHNAIIKNPLSTYTGEKLNFIQIYFENAEGSTKSENQEGIEKPLNQQNMSPTEKKEETRGRHIRQKNSKNMKKKPCKDFRKKN